MLANARKASITSKTFSRLLIANRARNVPSLLLPIPRSLPCHCQLRLTTPRQVTVVHLALPRTRQQLRNLLYLQGLVPSAHRLAHLPDLNYGLWVRCKSSKCVRYNNPRPPMVNRFLHIPSLLNGNLSVRLLH